MKTIGYFDGVDSILLTKLVASGHRTLPLSNEWDSHGKIASHLEPGEVDLIITYLHKLLPGRETLEKTMPAPLNLLFPAKSYNIPVLVVIPKEFHKEGVKILGEVGNFAEIVTPEELEAKVRKILEF
ncbi:MAG: hypothetical protein RTV31_04395 [Candidatus Thorarchaeota archaeon]